MNGEQTTAIQRVTRTKLALRERQRQALELRKAGETYQQIADALGYKSKCGAYKAVDCALREVTREPAEAVRQLELQRLDAMLATLWPLMQKGDIQALAGCLKIGERRARLLGLDADTSTQRRHEVAAQDDARQFDGLTAEQMQEEATRLLEAVKRSKVLQPDTDTESTLAAPPGASTTASLEPSNMQDNPCSPDSVS